MAKIRRARGGRITLTATITRPSIGMRTNAPGPRRSSRSGATSANQTSSAARTVITEVATVRARAQRPEVGGVAALLEAGSDGPSMRSVRSG
jgi:hypothetical protein